MERKLNRLYTILSVAFAGLILTNLGVSGVFMWQTKQVRQQLDQNRRAIARYRALEEPVVTDALSKLESYGLQNRDYQPILQKYAPLFPRFQQQAAAAAAKSAAPTPASLATPPKTGTR